VLRYRVVPSFTVLLGCVVGYSIASSSGRIERFADYTEQEYEDRLSGISDSSFMPTTILSSNWRATETKLVRTLNLGFTWRMGRRAELSGITEVDPAAFQLGRCNLSLLLRLGRGREKASAEPTPEERAAPGVDAAPSKPPGENETAPQDRPIGGRGGVN
jgi:hypothetical protein